MIVERERKREEQNIVISILWFWHCLSVFVFPFLFFPLQSKPSNPICLFPSSPSLPLKPSIFETPFQSVRERKLRYFCCASNFGFDLAFVLHFCLFFLFKFGPLSLYLSFHFYSFILTVFSFDSSSSFFIFFQSFSFPVSFCNLRFFSLISL